MILHIVNQSPFSHHALHNCLKLMGSNDSLLLIEDAVLLISSPNYMSTIPDRVRCYALLSDIEARGMQSKSNTRVETIDFEGFVDLVAHHDKTMSWF